MDEASSDFDFHDPSVLRAAADVLDATAAEQEIKLDASAASYSSASNAYAMLPGATQNEDEPEAQPQPVANSRGPRWPPDSSRTWRGAPTQRVASAVARLSATVCRRHLRVCGRRIPRCADAMPAGDV